MAIKTFPVRGKQNYAMNTLAQAAQSYAKAPPVSAYLAQASGGIVDAYTAKKAAAKKEQEQEAAETLAGFVSATKNLGAQLAEQPISNVKSTLASGYNSLVKTYGSDYVKKNWTKIGLQGIEDQMKMTPTELQRGGQMLALGPKEYAKRFQPTEETKTDRAAMKDMGYKEGTPEYEKALRVRKNVAPQMEDYVLGGVARFGNMISEAKGVVNKRQIVSNFYDELETNGLSTSDFLLPNKEAIASMNVKQLNEIANVAQSVGMSPKELKDYNTKLMEMRQKAIKEAPKAIDSPTKGREEFNKLSNPFVKIKSNYQRIEEVGLDENGNVRETGKTATGASDLSLIFAYMKMLDPTSVVREGEFATAAKAGNVPSAIIAQYNKVFYGDKLANDVRSAYMKEAKNIFVRELNNQKKLEQTYVTLAEKSGYDPSDVVNDYINEFRGDERLFGQSKQAEPETRVIPSPGNTEQPIAPQTKQSKTPPVVSLGGGWTVKVK